MVSETKQSVQRFWAKIPAFCVMTIFFVPIALKAADNQSAPAPNNNTTLMSEIQNVQEELAKLRTQLTEQNKMLTSQESVSTQQTEQEPEDPLISVFGENYQHLLPQEDEQLRKKAFENLLKEAVPLTPEQILRLRQLYQMNQRAATVRVGPPPTPLTISQSVNLAPGATPAVIRLSKGFVSSLVFIDSTGAPWPIVAYSLGNPKDFNIQWDGKSNIIMIQALTAYPEGNVAVRLEGLNTPIMLTLVEGQKIVDYRVDLRVRGQGPAAKALPISNTMPESADPLLLGILDGIAPPNSKILQVKGGEAQAWFYGDHLFLRTPLTVLSPGWFATMASADGTNAYKMQRTPLVLVSQHGRAVQLTIEGY